MHMQFVTILVMCILAGAEVDLFIASYPEFPRITAGFWTIAFSGRIYPGC
jgi:hypothetical protein